MAGFLSSLIPWRKKKPDYIAERRELNRKARALRKAITENLDPSFLTGADVIGLFDRYYANGQFFYPVTTSVPAIGGTQNKAFGFEAYTFRTEQDLRFQRDYARLLYAREPIARAIVLHLLSFILGNGFTYRVQPKKGQEVPDSEIKNCQEYLDNWCEEERWTLRERELVECKIVDGEFFLRLFNRNNQIITRRIEPEHITNKPGATWADGWFLGVHVEPQDVETVIEYGYRAVNTQDWKAIDVKDIIHDKANVTRGTSRGVSSFFCMLDDLDGAAKLSDNIRAGATARGEIAYMRSHKTATAATINQFADDQADMTGTNPTTNQPIRRTWNGPGKVVDHGENTDFTTMPAGDVGGNVEAFHMALRIIGNRYAMPEQMITGDYSNANFSSSIVAGGPFVRHIEAEQNQLKVCFKQVMNEVLKHHAAIGDIPVTLLNRLDILVEAPSPVIEDKVGLAQTMEIEIRNGIRSRQMCSSQLGLDPEEVQRDNDEWSEANMTNLATDLFSSGVANQNKDSNMNADTTRSSGNAGDTRTD